MKFLEILGLDALLEKTGSATGIVGGFLVFIGMMAWVFPWDSCGTIYG